MVGEVFKGAKHWRKEMRCDGRNNNNDIKLFDILIVKWTIVICKTTPNRTIDHA